MLSSRFSLSFGRCADGGTPRTCPVPNGEMARAFTSTLGSAAATFDFNLPASSISPTFTPRETGPFEDDVEFGVVIPLPGAIFVGAGGGSGVAVGCAGALFPAGATCALVGDIGAGGGGATGAEFEGTGGGGGATGTLFEGIGGGGGGGGDDVDVFPPTLGDIGGGGGGGGATGAGGGDATVRPVEGNGGGGGGGDEPLGRSGAGGGGGGAGIFALGGGGGVAETFVEIAGGGGGGGGGAGEALLPTPAGGAGGGNGGGGGGGAGILFVAMSVRKSVHSSSAKMDERCSRACY